MCPAMGFDTFRASSLQNKLGDCLGHPAFFAGTPNSFPKYQKCPYGYFWL